MDTAALAILYIEVPRGVSATKKLKEQERALRIILLSNYTLLSL